MTAAEWADRREAASPSLADVRVLVLEDDALQRETLVVLLRSLGVRHVALAASGEEALAQLDATPSGFDLTLCDLCMLDLHARDGLQFIRMAARRAIGALVVLSATEADVLQSAARFARGAGIASVTCLRKPATLRELEQAVRRVLHAGRAAQPSQPAAPPRHWCREALQDALRRREFIAFFQPKVALATGRLAGMEILARWMHPEAGLVTPSDFVPGMEAEGLIDVLTEQILVQGLDAVQRWKRQGLTVPIALNVSPLTLQKPGITDRWRRLLAERDIPTELLTVELTETAAAGDFQGLLKSVTRLRMHGFGVSLDDFGSGYSSLQLLCELPITEFKIDRSFVQRIPDESRAVLILDAIVELARKLRLAVVAEGIESADAAQFLCSAGCELGQGYHFGRPLPFAQITRTLAVRPPQPATVL